MISCSGRVSRLPFLAGVIVVCTALVALAGLLEAEGGRPAAAPALPVLALGLLCWSLTVLMLRRLSDMGRSRFHIVWILALSLLASIAGPPSLPAGLLLTLINIGIFIWLLRSPSVSCALPSPAPRRSHSSRSTG
jgi:uncharacterized membrane protein YhaH (DUF805 family)